MEQDRNSKRVTDRKLAGAQRRERLRKGLREDGEELRRSGDRERWRTTIREAKTKSKGFLKRRIYISGLIYALMCGGEYSRMYVYVGLCVIYTEVRYKAIRIFNLKLCVAYKV